MLDGSTFTNSVHVEECIYSSNNETAQYCNLLKDYNQELYWIV